MEAYLGQIAALGTACCWTVTAMAFESAGRRIGSLSVNFIRLVIALVLLTLFCWATRGKWLPLDASLHAWGWLAVSGLIGFTIGDLCLFRAFVIIGSRLSMLLMSLVPLFAALTGWIVMGERLAPVDWLGMALTISGVSWVVLERTTDASGRPRAHPVSGILLGIGGAFGQALGLVLSKFGMGSYDPFGATQIRVIAGGIGFAVLFWVIRWWPRVRTALADRGALARTGLGAFFGPFLGVSLSLLAVQNTQAGVAATLMALVPVIIIAPTVLIYRQRVSARAIAGAVVAVAGSALLFL
ncbi:MAG: EamA family transporter [Candidatus Eisenbacteria bacterium]|nr:EamA family transporter [Candidatus Latescibacterota bacterium]MBD3303131.1 EamA family transporter [Candidatus Eisenbacteria bacterium]